MSPSLQSKLGIFCWHMKKWWSPNNWVSDLRKHDGRGLRSRKRAAALGNCHHRPHLGEAAARGGRAPFKQTLYLKRDKAQFSQGQGFLFLHRLRQDRTWYPVNIPKSKIKSAHYWYLQNGCLAISEILFRYHTFFKIPKMKVHIKMTNWLSLLAS